VFGRSKKAAGAKAAKKPKPKKDKKPKAVKKAKPTRKATGVVVKKRPTDIYTTMLMMSLAFVTLSIIFMIMELGSYGFGFSDLTPWK
jgi:hypothetical protein